MDRKISNSLLIAGALIYVGLACMGLAEDDLGLIRPYFQAGLMLAIEGLGLAAWNLVRLFFSSLNFRKRAL